MSLLHKIINKIFILLGLTLGLLVIPANSIGQPEMKIGNYYNCSNTEVLIPVEIENFVDIAAFTIYIGVNAQIIDYIGIENINEEFSGGNFIQGFSEQSQYITFNWVSLSGANVESGLLCNIHIKLIKDYTSLSFLDDCEIVSSDLSIIQNVKYTDGTLNTLNSTQPYPISQSIIENRLANFEISGLANEVSYQWQKNNGDGWINIIEESPYSGVQTSTLTVQSVSSEMDSTNFRSLLSNGNCTEESKVVELFVTPVGIGEEIEKSLNKLLKVYPNPVNENLNCIINDNIKYAELRLNSLDGKLLLSQKFEDVISGQTLSLNLAKFENGIYILNLYDNSILVNTTKVIIL